MLNTKLINNSAGAVFIELVFLIPIILLLISSILFISELINAKGQLTLAVSEGPRLASTRGNNYFFKEGSEAKTVNSNLNNYIKGTSALPSILYSGFDAAEAENTYQSVSGCWKKLGENENCSPISEAHPIDLYALAYTYSMLKIGIPGIKYPCNPTDENSNSDDGCMLCVIAVPLPRITDVCPSSLDTDPNPHLSCPFDRALPDVGVICSYHPAGATANIIDRMIKFFSNGNGGLPEMLLTASTYPPGVSSNSGGGGGGPDL